MRSLKFGFALFSAVGVVALGGCGGPDAEQVIRKDPGAVYVAFEQALTLSAQGGTVGLGSEPVPYTVKLDKGPNERLGLTVLLNGQEAGEANFTFAPHNGGAETIVTGDIDVDLNLLEKLFGSTQDNRVAGVPPLAWNAGIRLMLRDAAQRIENGMPLDNGPELLTNSVAPWPPR